WELSIGNSFKQGITQKIIQAAVSSLTPMLSLISILTLCLLSLTVATMLMVGPPGSGKTLLARRLPTILPPLLLEEALEVTKLYRVAGLLGPGQSLLAERPFRTPHHTVGHAGLVGGGSFPRPGEIALAH